MRLIYLAHPYHAPGDPGLMEHRVEQARKMMALIARTVPDVCAYAPILQWHDVAKSYELPKDFPFWQQRDFFMIKKSSAMWVLPLPGWEDSFGLGQEIEFAIDINKPWFFALPVATSVVLTHDKPDRPVPLDF